MLLVACTRIVKVAFALEIVVYFDGLQLDIRRVVDVLKLSVVIEVVMSIFNVGWVLDGLLIVVIHSLSHLLGVIMRQITHLTCIAASAD